MISWVTLQNELSPAVIPQKCKGQEKAFGLSGPAQRELTHKSLPNAVFGKKASKSKDTKAGALGKQPDVQVHSYAHLL